MLTFLKPYVKAIKIGLVLVALILIGLSYYKVYDWATTSERTKWELKVEEQNRKIAEQRLKDLNDFNSKINQQKEEAARELAAAQALIEGFNDYVKQIETDSECLTSGDADRLRQLWRQAGR